MTVEGGSKAGLIVTTPAEGMAEVFYGLGEALIGEGAVGIGVLYLQMALYASPTSNSRWRRSPMPTRPTSSTTRRSRPTTAYPPRARSQSAVEIRKAFNLNSLERVDEARRR